MKTEQRPTAAKPGPTAYYVVRLLASLLRDESAELVLRESDELPSIAGVDSRSAGGFRRVANRFKVMAGITPMQYADSVSGSFIFVVADREATAELEFHDSADEPWFLIRCAYTGGIRARD